MERREIRVFISSTFRDMHAEREALIKRVGPALRALAARRRLGFFEVDLRWGITEEQASRGEVLPICLEEIGRCRPYFIGLLGERYGWVPEAVPDALLGELPWLAARPQSSVTEMEIVHGVLNDPEMATRALFYFRDPAWIDTLPPEQQAEFRAESPEAARRLAELKDRIRASGLPVREGYRSPKELADLVLADLAAAMDRGYPEDAAPNALEAQNLDHDLYMEERARFFVGQAKLLDQLDEHALPPEASLGPEPPLVLTSLAGDGKSAILAAWCLRFRQGHPEVLLVPHFARAAADSSDVEGLAARILGVLKTECGISQPLPELRRQKLAALPGWLEMASHKRPIVLVLDGLDQLKGPTANAQLSWLPHRFPKGVSVVLSCGPGPVLEELRGRGYTLVTPETLGPEEARAFTRAFLGSYRKALDAASEQQIVESAPRLRRQGLRLLLEELRVFGVHEALAERLKALLAAKEPRAQFLLFLRRLEEDFQKDSPGLVRRALSLLRAARTGLAEEELLELLGVPRLHWSWLRLALGELLVSRQGLLSFADEALREAAAELAGGQAADQEAHRMLADYFASSAVPERRLQEYGHQLMASAQWPRLREALTDLRFLSELWQADAPEALRLWAALGEKAGVDLPQAYAPALEHQKTLAPYVDTLFDLFRETGHPAAASRVALLGAAAETGDGPATPRQLQRIGVACLEERRPQEALRYLQEAAGSTAALIGEGNAWAAVASCNLAAAQRMAGNTAEALPLYEGALKVLLEQWGEDNPYTQEAVHGLGVTHYFRKDYERALELFRRSLAIQLRIKGQMDAETAVVRNDLGNTLGFLGRYELAAAEHREALTIREALYGPRHPLVADSCFNLGNILDLSGHLGEALSLHSRALSIRLERLGGEHPEVGRSQSIIASICQRFSQGLVEQLKPRKNREDPVQVQMAFLSFQQIGVALSDAGLLAPAVEALGRALALAEALHGYEHPVVASVLTRLGELSLRARQPAQALPHLRRALGIHQSAAGGNPPELADTHELLGMAHRDAGDLVLALDHFEACLSARMRRLGPVHPSVGQCYANIGGVHLRAGRLAEAERYTRQALEIAEATAGPDDPQTARACGNLGTVLLRLGRVPEGLALLKRDWQILRRAKGDEHPLTRRSAQYLRNAEERSGSRV